MRLLIDAYNVLHAWRGAPAEREGHAEVVALAGLVGRSRYGGAVVKLVCDGAGPSGVWGRVKLGEEVRGGPGGASGPRGASGRGSGGGSGGAAGRGRLEAVYAGPGRDADSLIERLLAKEDGAREAVVVSSDRRLRRAAGRAGARWLGSPAFLAQVVRDASAPARTPERPPFARKTPLDGPSVRFWAEQLGIAMDAELAELVEGGGELPGELRDLARRGADAERFAGLSGGRDRSDEAVIEAVSRAGGGVRGRVRTVGDGGSAASARIGPMEVGGSAGADKKVAKAEAKAKAKGRTKAGGRSSAKGERGGVGRGGVSEVEAAMLRDLDRALSEDGVLRAELVRYRKSGG